MRRGAILLAVIIVVYTGSVGTMAAGSGNSANDNLLAMSPEQQARTLTKGIKGCVGTSPFPMGVTSNGKAKGYAYWSVRCNDGRSFVVQIAPSSRAVAADCRELEGTGKECFKKF